MNKCAIKAGSSNLNNIKLLNTKEYSYQLRKSLFLGLSDGARTDVFRRFNPIISHEQVYLFYDIPTTKGDKLLNKLNNDLNTLLDIDNSNEKFNMLFLLDDFTGSGISYMRKEKNEYEGKIARVLDNILQKSPNIYDNDVEIHIFIYIATNKAIEKIKSNIDQWKKEKGKEFKIFIDVIFKLPDSIKIKDEDEFTQICKKYFDNSIIDEHFKKGECNKPYYGFDECGLPLVIYHNTPNNSIPVIWFDEEKKFNGIFPRVTRHRREQ